MNLKQLPLHDLHREHGATFGTFAGFEVPEAYRLSTVHEHLHTRKSAGLFDISHKSQIEISGQDATSLISRLCPVNAEQLKKGAVKYSFFLNEEAGIIDHLIIMRLELSRFLLIVNGLRAETDLKHIHAHSQGARVNVKTLNRALIALQGPEAGNVLESLKLPVANLAFMTCIEAANGYLISRSGYTGESGVEISLPANECHALARKLLRDRRVTLSGQSARNSLRLEAGLCRYGNDLNETISPVEAGLLRAIPKFVRRTGLFIGAPALMKKLAQGGRYIRVGLTPRLSTIVREGAPILDARDNEVGYVSSTSHGPSVGSLIAMGYVHSNVMEFGLSIFAFQDGKKIPLNKRKLPFIPSTTTKHKH